MSTILDALRKAKAAPPKDAVEARREILSHQSHDYLATVPESHSGQMLALKVILGFCLLTILALGALLVGLMLGRKVPLSPVESAPVVSAAPVVVAPAVEPVTRVVIERRVVEPAPVAPTVVATGEPEKVASAEAPPLIATPVPTQVPTQVPTAVPTPRATAAPKVKTDPGAAERRARAERLLGGLRITGIVWDAVSPMAMVDGKLLKVGSYINTAKVVRIERDAVVLSIDGEEYFLQH